MSTQLKTISNEFPKIATLFLDIWFKANNSHMVNKLAQSENGDIYDQEINRDPDTQRKIKNIIEAQKGKFHSIVIKNTYIPVLISPQGYVVINLLKIQKNGTAQSFENYYSSEFKPNTDQDKLFLTLKVIKNNTQSNKLKIGCISYEKDPKGIEEYTCFRGCRTKPLVAFMKYNDIDIPVQNTDKDKVSYFTNFLNYLKNTFDDKNIFYRIKAHSEDTSSAQNDTSGTHYYIYFFNLQNELKSNEHIQENIDYYRSVLKEEIGENKGSKEANNHVFRNDALPIDSPYYIRRRLDQKCESEIQNIAGFVRLKGVHKIGKTSLLYRIIEKGKSLKYSTIFIDFQDFESTYLDNVHNFCIRFCQEIASQLEKEDETNSYFGNGNSESNPQNPPTNPNISRVYQRLEFDLDSSSSQFESDNELSSTTKVKDYFEEEFLTDDTNILLVMDNIDKVFEQETLSQEIGNMLARWHKDGKVPNNKGEKWAKLKMVLAHSTDYYAGSPNINESPLKGIDIVPNEDEFDFREEEIEQLANKYEVQLRQNDSQTIKSLTGGHPYLIRLSLEYLTNNNNDITNLLNIASTISSPFIKYLRDELLKYLEEYPTYKQAFIQVLTTRSIRVNNDLELQKIEFKLGALGLIKKEDNNILPRCQLYKDYFKRVLIDNEQSL